MKSKRNSKKAQMQLGDGPAFILLIGFIFIVMATVAYVAAKYQDSFDLKDTEVVNETMSAITEVPVAVALRSSCNFASMAVSACINQTGIGEGGHNETIGSGNYTVDASRGTIAFTGDDISFNNSQRNCTYTFKFSDTECNVTEELASEILDNTSMVGMIITIGLIGIVLGVLLGVFASRNVRGV